MNNRGVIEAKYNQKAIEVDLKRDNLLLTIKKGTDSYQLITNNADEEKKKLNKEKLKDISVLDKEFHSKYIKSIDDLTHQDLMRDIDSINKDKGSYRYIQNNINNLKKLIDKIEKMNAITTIGTMDFIDMMAKYGLNKSICNYKNNDDDIIKKLHIDEIKDLKDDLDMLKSFSIKEIKDIITRENEKSLTNIYTLFSKVV